jgi:hypothetical protein
MSFSRTTIATAATIAALGVLATVALASGGEEPTPTAPAPTAETDPPVEVRTQVIRRTIHKRPKATASSGSDDGTLDQGPGDRPRIPVAAAAPAAAAPSTSGPGPSGPSGDHHDDDDRHHGGDDDFDDDHGDDDDDGDDDSGHGRGRGRGGDDD